MKGKIEECRQSSRQMFSSQGAYQLKARLLSLVISTLRQLCRT